MTATPRRSPRQRSLTRVSPNPLRSRTPTSSRSPLTSHPSLDTRVDAGNLGPQSLQATEATVQQLTTTSPATPRPATRTTSAPARAFGSLPTSIATTSAATSLPRPGGAPHAAAEPDQAASNHLNQLVLRPVVKATIAQRDTSAETLDDVVINGGSFHEIIQKIWNLFSGRVKCRAVRTDGEWSVETHDVAEWDRVMQFRAKKKVVESTKSEQAWRHRDAIVAACIQPEETDRAGATAEASLRDVVEKHQEQWGTTFQGDGVVWRMWANHLTWNLNRSTWEAAIQQPPPDFIANLLRLLDSQVEQHLAGVTRTANLALDVVEDHQELRRRWGLLGQYLDENERRLEVRKSVIVGFLRDIIPPSRDEVIDPLLQIENVEDTEHAE